MKVQIISMVKDEDDIIEHFINYYGRLFDYSNIYIIDNLSTDKTYEILLNYKKTHHIKVYKKNNYLHKGEYIKNIIKENISKQYDFIIPVDIDEFLVLFDDNTIQYNTKILKYLKKLNVDSNKIIGVKYLNPIMESEFFTDPLKEIQYSFHPDDMLIKGIIKNNNIIKNIEIDHGNHLWHYKKQDSKLCFIHYHARNQSQHIKKIINNYKGLGYDDSSVESIKKTINSSNNTGEHHQKNMLKIIQKTYQFPKHQINNYDNFIFIGKINKYLSCIYNN